MLKRNLEILKKDLENKAAFMCKGKYRRVAKRLGILEAGTVKKNKKCILEPNLGELKYFFSHSCLLKSFCSTG